MRRGWWVLLVLAAVFSMHGLSCVGDGSHSASGHGVAPTVTSLSLASASDTADPAGHDDRAEVVARGGGPHPAQPASSEPTSSAPETAAADLWALCLAVVTAGLIVLAAARVRPGSIPKGRPAGPSAQVWFSTPALGRPPDLFALCVLRN